MSCCGMALAALRRRLVVSMADPTIVVMATSMPLVVAFSLHTASIIASMVPKVGFEAISHT